MKDNKATNEIDILALLRSVLKQWKTLTSFLIVGAIIGVIVALSKPKEYTSTVVLAPELSSGGLGMSDNLADMASNFGIDLGGKTSMDAIYPELYPDILASTDFILKLFTVPVRLKNDDKVRTYLYHVTKEQKAPFWEYPKVWLISLFKKSESSANAKGAKADPFKISKREAEICNGIRKSILCNIDKKTSVISISVTDQDPLVAAIMADTLQSRLQQYITRYRTSKARNDYNFYKKMTEEARADYLKAQRAYASFSDANTDVLLESYKAKTDQLENEMQLKYNNYTQMAAQKQQALTRVQERTPAFTIMEKPLMPYLASSTPRSFIVLLFMFVAGIADVCWVLYKSRRTSA